MYFCLHCGQAENVDQAACKSCKSVLVVAESDFDDKSRLLDIVVWQYLVPIYYSALFYLFGMYTPQCALRDYLFRDDWTSLFPVLLTIVSAGLYGFVILISHLMRKLYYYIRLVSFQTILESKGWHHNESIFLPSCAPDFIAKHFSTREPITKPGRRKTFSASAKAILWKHTYGNHFEVVCKICRVQKITALQFQVSHIIPLCKGGTNDLKNLTPICATCNRSMGKENANEFAKMLTSMRL